ncbi:MarR family transcriptional regulator [Ferrovibrio sp.]|uniref:MarR family winged helix-turn-helix transcriptional regulator n=1 Tax=Ferrovibrio sp. TaxID=1917215 RepID=UPI001B599483|nr:MarR family transcriptional regulator [Ferrovibrio sp.]MBP7064189.1 MarR family transcriptional regulator [Ferrovibrio sp.]
MASHFIPESNLLEYVLLDAPGHLLRRCHQLAVDLYTEEVGEDGPTPPQFALLLTVLQNPGLSQVDLVRHTGIDRSTVAEMVARLIKRGLLDRNRTVADRRTNALGVTEAGEAVLQRALPMVLKAQERTLAPLNDDDREELMRLLRLLSAVNAPAKPQLGATLPEAQIANK